MADDMWAELQASTRAADAAFAAALGRGSRATGSTPVGAKASVAQAKAVAASILGSQKGDAAADLASVTQLLRVSRAESSAVSDTERGSSARGLQGASDAERLVRAAALAQVASVQAGASSETQEHASGAAGESPAGAWALSASASPDAVLASLNRATNTLADGSSQPATRAAAVASIHATLGLLVERLSAATGAGTPEVAAVADAASSGSLFFEVASRAILDDNQAHHLSGVAALVFPSITLAGLRSVSARVVAGPPEGWAWDGLSPLPSELGSDSKDIEDATTHDAATAALSALQTAWGAVAKPLSGALDDPSEAVRLAAVQTVAAVVPWLPSLAASIPYLLPRLASRTASTWVMDPEQKVFAVSAEALDAYRRGRVVATSQGIIAGGDSSVATAAATSITAAAAHGRVAEPSEAVRARLAGLLNTLLIAASQGGYIPLVGPYLQDVVLGLHALAVDPDPEVRLRGCFGLVTLTSAVPSLVKYFAVALVRSLAVAGLDHRYARVRLATLAAIEALVACLDDAKGRGAGSEALLHLMGQREVNVVSVSSFYGADATTINYCAKLAADTNPVVRLAFTRSMAKLITSLPDRYDWFPRLLPYVLSAAAEGAGDAAAAARRVPCIMPGPKGAAAPPGTEIVPAAPGGSGGASLFQRVALAAMVELGQQHEEEHIDKIAPKVQMGMDGDPSIDYRRPTLPPFYEAAPGAGGVAWRRPGIGTRIFIRTHARRFMRPLLTELAEFSGSDGFGSSSSSTISVATASGAGAAAAWGDRTYPTLRLPCSAQATGSKAQCVVKLYPLPAGSACAFHTAAAEGAVTALEAHGSGGAPATPTTPALRAAHLLASCVVMEEENITGDLHLLVPTLVKAIHDDSRDGLLHAVLRAGAAGVGSSIGGAVPHPAPLSGPPAIAAAISPALVSLGESPALSLAPWAQALARLVGRFAPPDAYVSLLLPLLRGDAVATAALLRPSAPSDSASAGVHNHAASVAAKVKDPGTNRRVAAASLHVLWLALAEATTSKVLPQAPALLEVLATLAPSGAAASSGGDDSMSGAISGFYDGLAAGALASLRELLSPCCPAPPAVASSSMDSGWQAVASPVRPAEAAAALEALHAAAEALPAAGAGAAPSTSCCASSNATTLAVTLVEEDGFDTARHTLRLHWLMAVVALLHHCRGQSGAALQGAAFSASGRLGPSPVPGLTRLALALLTMRAALGTEAGAGYMPWGLPPHLTEAGSAAPAASVFELVKGLAKGMPLLAQGNPLAATPAAGPAFAGSSVSGGAYDAPLPVGVVLDAALDVCVQLLQQLTPEAGTAAAAPLPAVAAASAASSGAWVPPVSPRVQGWLTAHPQGPSSPSVASSLYVAALCAYPSHRGWDATDPAHTTLLHLTHPSLLTTWALQQGEAAGGWWEMLIDVGRTLHAVAVEGGWGPLPPAPPAGAALPWRYAFTPRSAPAPAAARPGRVPKKTPRQPAAEGEGLVVRFAEGDSDDEAPAAAPVAVPAAVPVAARRLWSPSAAPAWEPALLSWAAAVAEVVSAVAAGGDAAAASTMAREAIEAVTTPPAGSVDGVAQSCLWFTSPALLAGVSRLLAAAPPAAAQVRVAAGTVATSLPHFAQDLQALAELSTGAAQLTAAAAAGAAGSSSGSSSAAATKASASASGPVIPLPLHRRQTAARDLLRTAAALARGLVPVLEGAAAETPAETVTLAASAVAAAAALLSGLRAAVDAATKGKKPASGGKGTLPLLLADALPELVEFLTAVSSLAHHSVAALAAAAGALAVDNAPPALPRFGCNELVSLASAAEAARVLTLALPPQLQPQPGLTAEAPPFDTLLDACFRGAELVCSAAASFEAVEAALCAARKASQAAAAAASASDDDDTATETGAPVEADEEECALPGYEEDAFKVVAEHCGMMATLRR